MKCGEFKKPLTRMLCRRCYCWARRHGEIDKYLRVRAGKRYDNCIDCGEYGHIQGRDRCTKCHGKWYRSQPGWKERHARAMLHCRKERPEIYRAIESRRNKTEKRKKWREKYSYEYYRSNKEELKAYGKDWREAHPELTKQYHKDAREREKNAEGHTTRRQKELLFTFYCPDNCCPSCGHEFIDKDYDRMATFDHVVPPKLGGTDWPDNIQPICFSCNSHKRLNIIDYRLDSGEYARSLMS